MSAWLVQSEILASTNSLLSRADLGHLGKGWIVRDTTARRLPHWANGLFYPSWNRLDRFTVANSLTWNRSRPHQFHHHLTKIA